MKVITICNNKGGVGKTTTAVNVGAGLRRRGYNILLIDCDGQSNLTASLRVPVTKDCNTYNALTTKKTITPVEVLPVDGGAGSLSVLPSVPNLSLLEVEISQEPDRITRLNDIVRGYGKKYDYIIIDTPPTLGLLTLGALYASTEVFITAQPQYLAVAGLVSVTDIIRRVAKMRGGALPYKVLFTQYDKRKSLHRLAVEQVTCAGVPVFNAKIRDNVALGEAPAYGCDIFTYAPHSNGAVDYNAVVEEYLNGV